MSLREASEEIALYKKLWDNTDVQGLRVQQERDFELWGPYKYEMPKEEGAWESVATNSPKVLANKVIGIISSMWMKLYMDVEDEKEGMREKIANTERLANGCIWAADRRAMLVPSGKKLQGALASHAVLKGGTAAGVYWHEGKDGAPVCDIRTYDPEFCQWLEGDGETLWFGYWDKVPRYYLIKRYGGKVADGFKVEDSDEMGLVDMYTFWDADEWKVAVNGKYIDENKHGLGYIPISINSCGSVPYMKSTEYTDTMKWSWVSCFANTRDVYDLESKLLSIESSKAIDSGRKVIIGEYDSLKSDGEKPSLDRVGYGAGQRNSVLYLDTAKGQKFLGFADAPDNKVSDILYQRVRTDLDIMAGLDPIAAGHMNRSGSGALAAELRSAALEFINPFVERVESTLIWVAEEGVRQFKDGNYGEAKLAGVDSKKAFFETALKPSDVVDKFFRCELVSDRLRDEAQELAAAIQKVSYGLTSRRTARIQHNIVPDPDKENDRIDEEKAKDDPLFYYDNIAKYYRDKDDEGMALAYESISRLIAQRMMQQATVESLLPQGGEGGNKNKPSVVSPQMNFMNEATQPQRFTGTGV